MTFSMSHDYIISKVLYTNLYNMSLYVLKGNNNSFNPKISCKLNLLSTEHMISIKVDFTTYWTALDVTGALYTGCILSSVSYLGAVTTL